MLVMNFDLIKENYDNNLWDDNMVAWAVVKKKITAEDYKTITGKDYVQPVA